MLYEKYLNTAAVKKFNFNFYYNLNRLKNSPIKILKDDIVRFYLDKFKT